MWTLLLTLLVLGGGAAALWVNAGRAEGQIIAIESPAVIGQTGEIAVSVASPGGELTALTVTLSQGDTQLSVFDLATDPTGASVAGDRVTVTRPAGKRAMPDLRNGAAEVSVTAVRPVLFGLRQASATATQPRRS